MICPECEKDGLKSKVYLSINSTTSYYPPFFDEEGRYHNHDNNTTTTEYSCSYGHNWVDRRKGICWCGWKG